MRIRNVLLASVAALAAGQALACFTVYDRNNRIVYNGPKPPVDLSRPVHETLPKVFPGGHLVFGAGTDCPRESDLITPNRMPAQDGKSPLLTNVKTAVSMGLPHTIVADGIALVPQRPDDMRPGVMTAESGLPAPGGPNTAAMGAGPAPGAASQAPRRGPVITEMHNPPLTAVQPAPRGVYRSR